MNLFTIIFQFILTIPLTIILSYFQKKDSKRINSILIPTIYIIIVSAICPIVRENVFLIVIFEILIRNFYITNISNNSQNLTDFSSIIDTLISICLSFFTYNYFLKDLDNILPTAEEIKPFLWFLIIVYILYLYKISNKEKNVKITLKAQKNKTQKNIIQYAKYKNIYSNIVKSKSDLVNNITYAIMIYEDYRKPKAIRKINDYIASFTRKEIKRGIMQIPSYERYTDEESISISIRNFEKILKNTKLNEESQIKKVLSNYSEIEQQDILNIYQDIVNFNQKG